MRTDESLRLTIVPERPAHLLDPARHGRLAHKSTAPDRVHQLFLGDDTIVVPHEVEQDVERLRFQGYGLAVATYLEQGLVELDVVSQPNRHGSIVALGPSKQQGFPRQESRNHHETSTPSPRSVDRACGFWTSHKTHEGEQMFRTIKAPCRSEDAFVPRRPRPSRPSDDLLQAIHVSRLTFR